METLDAAVRHAHEAKAREERLRDDRERRQLEGQAALRENRERIREATDSFIERVRAQSIPPDARLPKKSRLKRRAHGWCIRANMLENTGRGCHALIVLENGTVVAGHGPYGAEREIRPAWSGDDYDANDPDQVILAMGHFLAHHGGGAAD